jgi:hypothetical protein
MPEAGPAQQRLEADLVDALGTILWESHVAGFDDDQWFAFSSVTPAANSLLARLTRRSSLANFVRQIAPWIDRDLNDPADVGEVSGVSGLRFRTTRAGIRLFRPGEDAAIVVVGVEEDEWLAAVDAAVLSHADARNARPWAYSPTSWTPVERAAYDHRIRPISPLPSVVLRRINALRFLQPYGVDAWSTVGGFVVEAWHFDNLRLDIPAFVSTMTDARIAPRLALLVDERSSDDQQDRLWFTCEGTDEKLQVRSRAMER